MKRRNNLIVKKNIYTYIKQIHTNLEKFKLLATKLVYFFLVRGNSMSGTHGYMDGPTKDHLVSYTG